MQWLKSKYVDLLMRWICTSQARNRMNDNHPSIWRLSERWSDPTNQWMSQRECLIKHRRGSWKPARHASRSAAAGSRTDQEEHGAGAGSGGG